MYCTARGSERATLHRTSIRVPSRARCCGGQVGFVVFNVLGFWLGVAESAVEMLFSSSFLSAAWNIGQRVAATLAPS